MVAFTERTHISVATRRKNEHRDPVGSIAAYATALRLVGCLKWLPEIAAPVTDEAAQNPEIARIQRPAAKSQTQWKKR